MKRGLWIVLLIPWLVSAQNICGILNNMVIIEDKAGTGKIGDEKWVIRESGFGIESVGKIKIKDRYDDLLLARVLSTESGYQIIAGDRVSSDFEEIASIYEPEETARHGRNLTSRQSRNILILRESPPDPHLRFGLSMGTLLPYQSLIQRTNYSYQIGALLQYGTGLKSTVMLELMYSFIDEHPVSADVPALNNQSVLNANALYRRELCSPVFMDIGAGVYVPRLSVTAASDQRKVNSLEYHYGVCAGVAVSFIQSGSLDIFVSPRYHLYMRENERIENVSVSMNFIL
jgi:hypothetical protein